MERKFRCIKEFSIELRDEDEFPVEGESFTVTVDSNWFMCKHSSISDIRLENENSWIEIDEHLLEKYFVEI